MASHSSEKPPMPDRRWQELCAHIRFTDEVSFKLLALVPLLSVAALSVSVMKEEPKFGPTVVLLSLFAAAITIALWIWERRNIQRCMWFQARAADLERDVLDARVPGQFLAFPDGPGGLGKISAERLVYGLATGAWLLLPVAVYASDAAARSSEFGRWGASVYLIVAAILGWYGWQALRVKIGIDPKWTEDKKV